nr:histone deacetylase 14 [Tanacetum cinerariifolium]
MDDMTAPTGQAPAMAPPVHTNDQILPRIRWVQTGYLKFSAKGTKRELFGMPIPDSLITADFREASYYQEYLAHVVKHRWFLAGEPARKPKQQHKKFRSTSFRFGNPNTGSVTSFGTMISFTYAFSASPSDKKLESHDTLEDRNDL